MFIDSHCHLDRLELATYNQTLGPALEAARALGVERFLTISVDLDDYHPLSSICQQHADVSMSVGVHPCENAAMFARVSAQALAQLAEPSYVWAIGETGLDYFHDDSLKPMQINSFAEHIAASKATALPLVVHTRQAKSDTIAVLREQQADNGILHCFTEDWQTAKAGLDLGFYISFSGIISFKSALELREVAKQVPLDRLLIETDSPYLAPMPHRGKSNEPKYVPLVAAALGDALGVSAKKIGEITTSNFKRLFAAHFV